MIKTFATIDVYPRPSMEYGDQVELIIGNTENKRSAMIAYIHTPQTEALLSVLQVRLKEIQEPEEKQVT